MNKKEASSLHLEILISTVDRNSLEFLDVMFQYNKLSDYQILIINQTSAECTVFSNDPKIRVINSFEKGISKSRNLAIENAVGDICLLADDDVVFLKGFENHIVQSHSELKDADVITFKTLTTENKPYSKYPKERTHLDTFCIYVLSIEISFKRLSIVNGTVRFNENFGLGATFQDSENHIFLLDLIKYKHLKLVFEPEFIVIHEPLSSSDEINSDRLIFARGALNYKLYGYWAYIYVWKLMFFLLRKNLINFNDIGHKVNVAHSGIKTYKNLKRLHSE